MAGVDEQAHEEQRAICRSLAGMDHRTEWIEFHPLLASEGQRAICRSLAGMDHRTKWTELLEGVHDLSMVDILPIW